MARGLRMATDLRGQPGFDPIAAKRTCLSCPYTWVTPEGGPARGDGMQPPSAGAVQVGMACQLSDTDAALDAEWRQAFGQPLPMLGAPDIARQILDQHWANLMGQAA